MAFFSSVFQKLTDPGYTDRQQIHSHDVSHELECDGEMDDFIVFTKSDDHSKNTAAMAPPLYNEVMSENNPVTGGAAVTGPDSGSNRAMISQQFDNMKISALDGVPVELWTGHMTSNQSLLLQQEIDSILLVSSEICDAARLHSGYKYSFDLERSVLKEYDPESLQDLSHLSDIYLPCNDSPVHTDLMNFNGDEKESRQPPTAVLVDLS